MAQIPTNITNEQSTNQPSNMYAKNEFGPEAFGSGLAKGLDRFSDTEYKLQTERNKDRDETDALNAYNQANKAKSYMLYDPNEGLYARQGEGIDGIVTDFERENRSIGDSASRSLSPKAKEHFDKMWARSEAPDREGVMKHEINERQKQRVSTGNATIDLAIANAVQDYANPDVVNRSKSEILGAVIQTFPGASKETIADAVLKGYSELHKGVILKLGVESPVKAEQYFKTHVEEMTAADNVAVSNMLRGQIFRSNVLRDAERITGTSGPVKALYDTLKQTSPKEGALMSAVTQQESGFKPTVRAYNQGNPEKTAVGLTQVLVGTAREISAELGDGLVKQGMTPKQIEAVLEDPKTNLRYGTHYLKKQLERFGGDLESALIAYNAGPGNAEKFLRAGRDYAVLPDRKQTEPYVRNVLSMYRRNLGEKGFPRTAQNMDDAGVQPAATDAQRESFRTFFDGKSADKEINGAVENGAAQLFDAMPGVVKEGIRATSSGGDLQIETDDPFAKEWVMMNADTFGITANDAEGMVTLSSGQGPTDMGVMIKSDEYDLNEWLKEAETIEDPARRAAVVKELMGRHTALQKANRQDENSLKQKAWELTLDGQDVPIELQKQLPPTYMQTLNEYTRKLNSEGKITTDWSLWASLRTKTDEELRDVGDVMQYRSKLADPEFKTLVDMVRESRGQGDPSKKGLTGAVRTRTQVVADTVGTHFKNKPEMVGKLNAAVDVEVTTFYDTYKKQPSAVELQGMVDRLVLRANVDSSYSDQYMFEVKPGETITDTLVSGEADVPVLQLHAARANFQELFGRALSPEEIPWAYTAALAHKRGAYVRTPPEIRQILIDMGSKPDRVDAMFGRVMADMFEVK